jgi:hypothetical protein
MEKNVGGIDKTIRVIVGVIIIALGVVYNSWWGAIGLIPIATALVGWCPPYALLGINTCKHKPKES